VTLPPASTGILIYDFATTQSGRHSVHWATTVPTTSDDDVFYAAPGNSLLISVDEAINHLRATTTISSDPDRETMQDLCLAVSAIIQADLGRALIRRTVTAEPHYGDSDGIVLWSRPVLSITSVTESGTLLTGSDWFLDPAGILRRGTATSPMSFAAGITTVTYVVGYADPPWAARQMAKHLVQTLWQESQQRSLSILDESAAFPEAALPGLLGGAPEPLRKAYNKLRVRGIA
jgi:hypothetical protein